MRFDLGKNEGHTASSLGGSAHGFVPINKWPVFEGNAIVPSFQGWEAI